MLAARTAFRANSALAVWLVGVGDGFFGDHLNDSICSAVSKAETPSSKDLSGLFTTDGKRPDGMTLIHWQAGRNLL